MKTITLPVTVIAGQQDSVTTVTDALYMTARIPNSQLIEINAAHISNIESPEAFTQALRTAFN